MAATVVQSSSTNAGSSTTSLARAFASNVTAGNAIVVAGETQSNAQSTTSVTDTRSNTYTRDAYADGGATNRKMGLYSAPNTTAGACTVTLDADTGYHTIFIYEVSGLATSAMLDVAGTSTGNAAAMAGPTLNTGNANDWIIAAVCQGNLSTTPTVSSGWTLGEIQTNATNMPGATAYRAVTATGSYANTFTYSAIDNYAIASAAYKEAAAGGTTFTLNVSGSISPAGALAKQVRRLVTGSISPAGTITKQAQTRYAGGISPAGALVNQPGKVLSGSIAPAGSVTRQAGKGLSGSVSPSGSLAKEVRKAFAGGITPAGVVTATRVILLALTGSISPNGALTKQAGKQTGGSVNPSGTLTKHVSVTYAGSVTPEGSLRKAIAKTFAGAIAPVGGLTTSLLGPALERIVATVALLFRRTQTVPLTVERLATVPLTVERVQPISLQVA